ncbi:proprotein convertase subtilisin/kexin type 9 isoform X2 [Takifugu rubripes]|uniref:Proprotein convertase subtilisin/kexin type 9 n=1 Tax=Takifugu rubripes TaxID=31033 RepID=A0A3B5JVK6_TAKRU|nr:proprotein convertase subtilisin/kexin type 9 isoform X2 [Takifugu rubripes]
MTNDLTLISWCWLFPSRLISHSLGIKPPSPSSGGVPTENNCTIIRDRSGGGSAVPPARSDGWLRDVTLTVGKTPPSRCSSAWSPGCDAQVRSRMRRSWSWSWSWSWMGCALCLCASLTGSARDSREDDIMNLWRENGTQPDTGTEPTAEILKCNKAVWRIPGQYLVLLRPDVSESHVQEVLERLRAVHASGGHLLEVLQTYTGALRGFLVKMRSGVLHLVARLPHVLYIEEDSSVFAQGTSWNLQRLMQPYGAGSPNGTHGPQHDGRKVEVYLMDGGILRSHRELRERVLITDFHKVPVEKGGGHREASRCESHGTHVAGVVSGSESGVARGAHLNLVRVLDCQGRGTVSGTLAGIEYIRAMLLARPLGAVVVLLPFIGGFSRSLNTACRDLVDTGAVVIAAAGNYKDDACLYSPASEPEVITVGAVNLAGQLMSLGAGGTNFGRCVDVFAPGDDIISASSDCTTCFASGSGTSQAAAHAAGIAAVILSSNHNLAPVQVLQTLLRHSISGSISFPSLSDTHRLITPNLVAALPAASSDEEELLCRSVWSERSGVRSTDTAVSQCRPREEMMSCSGHAPDGAPAGQLSAVNRGQCVAYNRLGVKGVHAVARCCVVRRPQQGHVCAHQQHAAEGCKAPSLECRLLENTSSDNDRVELSCPPGWTMTDCSAIYQGSAVFGSLTEGKRCRISAAGADGTTGIAVCCRVR